MGGRLQAALGGEYSYRGGDFGFDIDKLQPDFVLAESDALAPPNLGLEAHAVVGVVQLDTLATTEATPGQHTHAAKRQIEHGPQVALEELYLEPNRSPFLGA